MVTVPIARSSLFTDTGNPDNLQSFGRWACLGFESKMRCPRSQLVSGTVGTGVQTVCFGDQVWCPEPTPPPQEGGHSSGLCDTAQGSKLWSKVGQDEYLPTRLRPARVSCCLQNVRQAW